jgi:uncharacterized protein YcfL
MKYLTIMIICLLVFSTTIIVGCSSEKKVDVDSGQTLDVVERDPANNDGEQGSGSTIPPPPALPE